MSTFTVSQRSGSRAGVFEAGAPSGLLPWADRRCLGLSPTVWWFLPITPDLLPPSGSPVRCHVPPEAVASWQPGPGEGAVASKAGVTSPLWPQFPCL